MNKSLIFAASALALAAAPASAQLLGNVGGSVGGVVNGALGGTLNGAEQKGRALNVREATPRQESDRPPRRRSRASPATCWSATSATGR